MKLKFLALTLCMATLSCTSMNAQDTRLQPRKSAAKTKLLSKDTISATFFGASDNTAISFSGTSSGQVGVLNDPPTLTPLTFTQHKHANGKGIKLSSAGDYFLLDKGRYLVLFTGTFQVSATENERIRDFAPGVFFNVALQLGSNVIFTNGESHQANLDDTGITYISKVIKVDHDRTNLSVVVGNVSVFVGQLVELEILANLNALTRSITILKLDD
jgi:hypothetical protein